MGWVCCRYRALCSHKSLEQTALATNTSARNFNNNKRALCFTWKGGRECRGEELSGGPSAHRTRKVVFWGPKPFLVCATQHAKQKGLHSTGNQELSPRGAHDGVIRTGGQLSQQDCLDTHAQSRDQGSVNITGRRWEEQE